mgnify:CR=1 FL=1
MIVMKVNESEKDKDIFLRNLYYLHVFLCSWWGVQVELRFMEDEERSDVTGGGEFIPSEGRIYLYKKSFLIYFHEFRHALQYFLNIPVVDPEKDAIEWSKRMYNFFRSIFVKSFILRKSNPAFYYAVDDPDYSTTS